MLDWCNIYLVSIRLKASMQFCPMREKFKRSTYKGCNMKGLLNYTSSFALLNSKKL